MSDYKEILSGEDIVAGRDKDTFVVDIKDGRIGWEKTLSKGSRFSDYLLKGKTIRTDKELIYEGFSIATNVVKSMHLTNKVSLSFKDGESFTNGKVVVVNTSVFDDTSLEATHRIDVFVGFCIHECLHVEGTDFVKLNKEVSEFDGNKSIFKAIVNIIEDERIESSFAKEYPGFMRFIGSTKEYVFSKTFLEELDKLEEKLSTLPYKDRMINKMLVLLTMFIRFPKHISKDDRVEFVDFLDEVRMFLTPYPASTDEAIKCSKAIYSFFVEFINKEEEKEKEKDTSDEKSDESSEESKSDEKSDSKSESTTLSDESSSEEEKSEEKEEKEEKEDSEGVSSEDSDYTHTDSSEEDEGMDVLSEVSELLESITDHHSEEKANALKSDSSEFAYKIAEDFGKIIETGSNNTFFHRVKPKEGKYREYYKEISRYIPLLSKSLKFESIEQKLVVKSAKNGILDTNKLAEAVQGVQNVYERHGYTKSNKIAVVLLIDESGSMSGSSITKAAEVAVLLNESLSKIKSTEVYVYGHSADLTNRKSTDIYVYKEKGVTDKYMIGSIAARSQNRDGTAILETVKRVRKQTKLPLVVFVISDGAPCAGDYRGNSAVAHTRNCVLEAERKYDSVVIQIAVSVSYDPGSMFRHFVKFSSFSTLAKELVPLVKKVVSEKIKSVACYV